MSKYELFTNRARRVMALADVEARRLNHESIGTEHILLGLVKEGSGLAWCVLDELGVNLIKVRAEVEKLHPSDSKMVTMKELPLTTQAEVVIKHGRKEADDFARKYVETEHLLLGLLRVAQWECTECSIIQILFSNLNLLTEDVREKVLNLLKREVINNEEKKIPVKDDGAERIAIALERIADALEKRP